MEGDIESIVNAIFAEDVKYLNELVRSRRRMGLILMLLGMLMFFSPFGYLIYFAPTISPVTGQPNFNVFWLIFIIMFLGISLVRYGKSLRREAAKILKPGAGTYSFFSKLECPRCGFVMIRERKENEFVGDIAEEECEACKIKMRVVGIYAEPEREIKPIGYPILPMPGQSTMLELKAAVLNALTPLKLGLRQSKKKEKDNKT